MSVTVYIPGPLRGFTGGQDSVELPGAPATVAQALEALFAVHPGLRDRVLTETGSVRRHVNLFVDGERTLLEAPVRSGAELAILPAVSGGLGVGDVA
jgi:molybdopterin converting factor small subunit